MTTVVVLIGAAVGLRGHVTRWMVEIAPGVFVGEVSSRVAGKVWTTITERIRDGQAIMVRKAHTEQGWDARAAGVDRWSGVSLDGLTLFRRPGPRAGEDVSLDIVDPAVFAS